MAPRFCTASVILQSEERLVSDQQVRNSELVNQLTVRSGFAEDLSARGPPPCRDRPPSERWAMGDGTYSRPSAIGAIADIGPLFYQAAVLKAAVLTRLRCAGHLSNGHRVIDEPSRESRWEPPPVRATVDSVYLVPESGRRANRRSNAELFSRVVTQRNTLPASSVRMVIPSFCELPMMLINRKGEIRSRRRL